MEDSTIVELQIIGNDDARGRPAYVDIRDVWAWLTRHFTPRGAAADHEVVATEGPLEIRLSSLRPDRPGDQQFFDLNFLSGWEGSITMHVVSASGELEYQNPYAIRLEVDNKGVSPGVQLRVACEEAVRLQGRLHRLYSGISRAWPKTEGVTEAIDSVSNGATAVPQETQRSLAGIHWNPLPGHLSFGVSLSVAEVVDWTRRNWHAFEHVTYAETRTPGRVMRGRYELHAPRSYLEDNPARLVWPGRRAQLIPAGAEVVTEYEDAIVAVLTPTPAGGTMIEATYRPGTFRPYLAALMEALRALPIPPDRPRAETTRLSARHQDILTRYLNGDAVKAIANDVHFAPQTVHNILTALRRQLGEERVPRRHKPSGGWSQVETG